MKELAEHADGINRLMARFGVKFGIYKNGEFHEQLFPFDAISRVISHKDFLRLEKGLIQRVDALNLFLNDIYGDRKIIHDRIIPEEFVFISSGCLPECEGIPVIMTPGRYNAAYFEHSYLAEKTDSELATCSDLFVEDNYLWYRDYI